jgi:apolipoprotein N-acyltransferase
VNQSIWRIALPLICVGAAIWAGWDMVHRSTLELLWGWRPLVLLAGFWGAVILFIIGSCRDNRERRKRWILTTLSGLLLSLSFPPSPFTPLAFIGLVPLLMADESLRTQFGGAQRRKIFSLAFNTFFIWNICTTWWVLNTSFIPGIFANAANAALMACVFVLFHQARTVLPSRLHPFAIAALWIAFEYLHLNWEASWPWLTFGNSFAQYPSWIQWYEFTGVFGGSAWILLANYWIYNWYRSSGRSKINLALIICWLLIPIAWSVWRYATFTAPSDDVEVAIVQPNFEPHYEKFRVPQEAQLERFLVLARSALTDSTDYLVFPETSFGFIVLNELEQDFRIRALRDLASEYSELHIVTGLESYRIHSEPSDLRSIRTVRDRNKGLDVLIDVQNSAVQINAQDSIPIYFKSKLVPGAEHFPFRDILPFLKPLVDMLQGSIAGLTMQERRDVFISPESRIAPVICYESVYGEYCGGYIKNGAEIIFIMTNDGWWDETPGHIQHLKLGALRAIEHRRPIARSANSGISCFINARGDILQPTAYGEAAAISGTVAPGTEITVYTTWGDMIARVAVFLAVLLLALTVTRSVVPSKN